jgi:3-deoxy-D-arabino-heptulosonate 7-phosphate (DAHP) synthase
MIIAGPCLMINENDNIYKTAEGLQGLCTHFRCKLWGGGTRPAKFNLGIGADGLYTLEKIRYELDFKVGTEIQSKEQYEMAKNHLDYIWVGMRNAQNYQLLKDISGFKGEIFVKRGEGMTADDTMALVDIIKQFWNKDISIIERGIVTFDRYDNSRWSPDLKGVLKIKHERPAIFKNLVVDCSHSVFKKDFVSDVYSAFAAVGVENFMFECTIDGISKTDQDHMLSVWDLKNILGKRIG